MADSGLTGGYGTTLKGISREDAVELLSGLLRKWTRSEDGYEHGRVVRRRGRAYHTVFLLANALEDMQENHERWSNKRLGHVLKLPSGYEPVYDIDLFGEDVGKAKWIKEIEVDFYALRRNDGFRSTIAVVATGTGGYEQDVRVYMYGSVESFAHSVIDRTWKPFVEDMREAENLDINVSFLDALHRYDSLADWLYFNVVRKIHHKDWSESQKFVFLLQTWLELHDDYADPSTQSSTRGGVGGDWMVKPIYGLLWKKSGIKPAYMLDFVDSIRLSIYGLRRPIANGYAYGIYVRVFIDGNPQHSFTRIYASPSEFASVLAEGSLQTLVPFNLHGILRYNVVKFLQDEIVIRHRSAGAGLQYLLSEHMLVGLGFT